MRKSFKHLGKPFGKEKQCIDELEKQFGATGYAFYFKLKEVFLYNNTPKIKDIYCISSITPSMVDKIILFLKKRKHININTKGIIEENITTKDQHTSITDADIYNVVNVWNSIPSLQSKRIPISLSLSEKIVKRLKEKAFDINKIKEAILQQPFLLGNNNRGWKASLDFVVQNDNNYIKILEKNYTTKSTTPHGNFQEDIEALIKYYKNEKTNRSIEFDKWSQKVQKFDINDRATLVEFKKYYINNNLQLKKTFQKTKGIENLLKEYKSISNIISLYDKRSPKLKAIYYR